MKRAITITAAAAITAATLAGCTGQDNDADAICVNRRTHERVDDYHCDHHESSYYPWYLTQGQSAPAMGRRAYYGSATAPKGSHIYRGRAPRSGGVTTPQKKPIQLPKWGSNSNPNKSTGKAPNAPYRAPAARPKSK